MTGEMLDSRPPAGLVESGGLALCAVVLDGGLDGVLREHRAVQLDRGQTELLRDLGVLDARGVVERHAVHELRHVAGRGDGGPAAKGLELDVLYHAGLVVDADLQLHHVAARGRADEPGPHVRRRLVERAHVARVRVVVYDFRVVRTRKPHHPGPWPGPRPARRKECCSDA